MPRISWHSYCFGSGMEDYFLITFKADGINYTAKVSPGFSQDGNVFYQVQFEKDKTIFLEMGSERIWKLKEDDFIQPKVSGNFIYHAGGAIESHEDWKCSSN